MGQKPRVCSSYFFEMEDGSRIEVRRELFLSWLQRGNHDENKTEQIQEMGKTPPPPGRQQEPEGSEQIQRKLRMFERALGNFSNEEQSLIYYRYYKGLNSKYDTKPVEISLLSANRKISNMIFSLNFYQKDAVGGNREAATYQLYFTDSSGKTISDVQKIIADKTSDIGQERTFRCSFNLKSLKYNSTDSYYLVIADENGLQVQREEFQIDIAFAVDEFDFFG